MRHFCVVTPEYLHREIVDPELGGPLIETRDVFEIDADCPGDAKRLAVRAMRQDNRRRYNAWEWLFDAESDGVCPFSGLEVWEQKGGTEVRVA